MEKNLAASGQHFVVSWCLEMMMIKCWPNICWKANILTFWPEIKSWARFGRRFSYIKSCQTKSCSKINILVKEYAFTNTGLSTFHIFTLAT